jgi:hypothetical protein
MPVSPAIQRLVEVTMRTAPVDVLTHAEIFVETGPAMAAVPARNTETRTPKCLREEIETSYE